MIYIHLYLCHNIHIKYCLYTFSECQHVIHEEIPLPNVDHVFKIKIPILGLIVHLFGGLITCIHHTHVKIC